ncbi:uncharacterized protein [Palaemon carinicauda]|uniref:uncharacterized protein n=1 Tax=Palaemon carinicauda TaxID=392227 RepID=UPI0035B6785D
MTSIARLQPAIDGSPREEKLLCAHWIRCLPKPVRAPIPDVNSLPMIDMRTKADTLMDSYFTTFKTTMNASSPDEEDTYLTSTEDDMNAVGHTRLPRDVPERRQSHPSPITQSRPNQRLLQSLTAAHQQQFRNHHSRFRVAANKCAKDYQWPKNVLSKSADVRLVAANRSAIPSYGCENLTLLFGKGKFNWKFFVTDVTLPILGEDILSHFHLLVDVAHRQLINADSYLLTSPQPAPSNLALQISPPMEDFRPELRQTPTALAKHGIYHHIKMMGPPVFAKLRLLSPDRFAAAKQTFAEMEEMCFCQKASSPWSSPLNIVMKKDNSLSPCGDYRHMNIKTELDHYPLPDIAGVISYLHKAKVFSSLYLLKGYYEVPMNPKHISKPAITTPFEEHLRHLTIVFNHRQQNGLVVRYGKCTLGANEVLLLWDYITPEEVHPLPEKVAAVQNFSTHSNVKTPQEFLRMINYYRRFLPAIAATLAPFYASLKGRPRDLKWCPLQESAFYNAKNGL